MEANQPPPLGDAGDEHPGLVLEVLRLVHDDGVPTSLAEIGRLQVHLAPGFRAGVDQPRGANSCSIHDPPPTADTYAGLCGPPIMIKFTLPTLAKLGFPDERVFTTLENRMKCGIGKCGRCNVGPVYVCKDGPVFTAAQLKLLPAEY